MTFFSGPAAAATGSTPPLLLAQGFRIFFSLAGLWSVMAMSHWLWFWSGGTPPATILSPALHHGHEMLCGFVAAAAAGFMLTATPVWSHTPGLQGVPLAGLAAAWLAGRLDAVPFLAPPAWLPALGDQLFFAGFLAFIGPTLWATGNRIHRIFPLLLGLLAVGDLLVHLESTGLATTARAGLLLGIDAIVFFLVMTGGHIMPMFTREALKARGLELPFVLSVPLEIASALSLTLVTLSDLFFPASPGNGWSLVVAALIQALRLSRWHGLRTLQTPLLWVLHLGYLWLVLGLLARGLAGITGMIDHSSALHALSVGAMGLFTLGIMSRIALTHTGRPLQLAGAMTAAFGLVTAGAVIRVTLFAARPELAVALAGGMWIGAFALFCFVFLPILSTPRPDGQAG